jgi:hypothetical protein
MQLPHCFKDGSLSKPVMLDDDDVSEALLDLTNTQMMKKKPPKRHKGVFYPARQRRLPIGLGEP